MKREFVLPTVGLTSVQLAALAELPSARDVIRCARALDESIYDGRTMLPPASVELIVEELDLPLKFTPQQLPTYLPSSSSTNMEKKKRVPVVTVMGHVDHGKTSLLDRLRKTDVASGEIGGITQSVAAFSVRDVATFIDTPGHAAFSAMRRYGAVATDVVVLVVAVDDGVMPQTEESVSLARAADVPIVVAITKIDKLNSLSSSSKKKKTNATTPIYDAQVQAVRAQLLDQLGLHSEQIGGDVQCVEVSARTGEGIPDLLEAIALQADMMELHADTTSPALAICLESRVDRSLAGTVATLVVRDGVLRTGNFAVFHHHTNPHHARGSASGLIDGSGGAGTDTQMYGKVKRLIDPDGKDVKMALPGQAVGLMGLAVPIPPGSRVCTTVSEREAKTQAKSIGLRNSSAVTTIQTANRMLDERALKAHRQKLDSFSMVAGATASATNTKRQVGDSAGTAVTGQGATEVDADLNMEEWLREYEGTVGARVVGDNKKSGSDEGDNNLDSSNSTLVDGNKKRACVQVVIKGDVRGSADAVAHCVQQLASEQVEVRVVKVGVGEVTEADVRMGSVTHDLQRQTQQRRRRRSSGGKNDSVNSNEPKVASVMVCFNVKIRDALRKLCDRAQIRVVSHNIIYHIDDEMRAWIDDDVLGGGGAGPASVRGHAAVRRVFEGGAIAGCVVNDGEVRVGDVASVVRRVRVNLRGAGGADEEEQSLTETVHQGTVESIKQFAKDVRSVAKGSECGIRVSDWEQFEAGDEVEVTAGEV